MSGIKKRTIYMTEIPYVAGEKSGRGVKRFGSEAMVITGQGYCVEPFTVNDLLVMGAGTPASYDPKDMMRRIDDVGGSTGILRDDNGTTLHSYEQWLRVGP